MTGERDALRGCLVFFGVLLLVVALILGLQWWADAANYAQSGGPVPGD